MKKSIVIVAAGKGVRMGSNASQGLAKQFIEVQQKPILIHTIEVFHSWDPTAKLVVVLAEEDIEYWKETCKKHRFEVPHLIVTGGETRQESVYNGLKKLSEIEQHEDHLVAVHDGVRPCVTHEIIQRVFDAAALCYPDTGAIPVIDPIDSLRWVHEDGRSEELVRSKVKYVQTPQCFPFHKLLEAYEKTSDSSRVFTDDASLFEWVHHKSPKLVEGDIHNLKVTTEIDLIVLRHLKEK